MLPYYGASLKLSEFNFAALVLNTYYYGVRSWGEFYELRRADSKPSLGLFNKNARRVIILSAVFF